MDTVQEVQVTITRQQLSDLERVAWVMSMAAPVEKNAINDLVGRATAMFKAREYEVSGS